MEFIITNRKGETFTIFYDEDDHDLIKNHTWHLAGRNPSYVKTNMKQKDGTYKSIPLHRLILQLKSKDEIGDHKNRNTFDNRRNNLRKTDKRGNNFNCAPNKNTTSKYKGVDWDRCKSRWRAQLQVNRKRIYIGRFKEEIAAAHAYDSVAKIQHGEFANLNFK